MITLPGWVVVRPQYAVGPRHAGQKRRNGGVPTVVLMHGYLTTVTFCVRHHDRIAVKGLNITVRRIAAKLAVACKYCRDESRRYKKQ